MKRPTMDELVVGILAIVSGGYGGSIGGVMAIVSIFPPPIYAMEPETSIMSEVGGGDGPNV